MSRIVLLLILLTSTLIVGGCTYKKATDIQLSTYREFSYVPRGTPEYMKRDVLREGNCLDYAYIMWALLHDEVAHDRLRVLGCRIPQGYHAVCVLDDELVFDVNHRWPQSKSDKRYEWIKTIE